MDASAKRARTLLVAVLGVCLVAAIGWFLASGVPIAVLICLIPILASAHVLLGGILWFVVANDEPV